MFVREKRIGAYRYLYLVEKGFILDGVKVGSNEPIEPMDLANMRANGVRSLLIWYRNCRHEKVMNVDHKFGNFHAGLQAQTRARSPNFFADRGGRRIMPWLKRSSTSRKATDG
jgi:hypothetical protein